MISFTFTEKQITKLKEKGKVSFYRNGHKYIAKMGEGAFFIKKPSLGKPGNF